MKIINRSRDKVLLRRLDDPHFHPWTEWCECEGAVGLTQAECEMLVHGWSEGEATATRHVGHVIKVSSPYEQEEYRIVEDGFDLERLNEVTQRSYAGQR